jgi:hypothetical protein
MKLGLIRRDDIMHLDEHDEQIQRDRYTAPVGHTSLYGVRIEWEGIGSVGAPNEGGVWSR